MIATATQNKKGFTYQLSKYGRAFVLHAATCTRPVADIGAAFGVATIPALAAGAKVIAVDVEESHLAELRNETPQVFLDNLTTRQGRFPYIDFEPGSLDACYISQVLPFLSGEEITQGIEKLHEWLSEDGKIFIVSFTPYIAHVASYIPIYEQKRDRGIQWAGYIDNLKSYSKNNAIADQLPDRINHVDINDMERVLEGLFHIEKIEYFGDEENALPEGIKYDGRERIGIIARKI